MYNKFPLHGIHIYRIDQKPSPPQPGTGHAQGSHLAVQVFDRVPYFAYHKQDDQTIIGFYFSSDRGDTSPAYELIDGQTKGVFAAQFNRIMADVAQNTLVEFDGATGRPSFDDHLFVELHRHPSLAAHLGKEKAEELLGALSVSHTPDV
jgi:hypothetical protein